MEKLTKIQEIWEYLKTRKKWYLIPLIIILLVLSTLMILSEGSAIAPFIYAIF